MQDRHLCWSPYFSLTPQCPRYFFNSRIATELKEVGFNPKIPLAYVLATWNVLLTGFANFLP